MAGDAVGLDVATAISVRSIIERLDGMLERADLPREVCDDLVSSFADAYLTGVRDGARDAIAQVASAAAQMGLHLRLAPELCEPEGPE